MLSVTDRLDGSFLVSYVVGLSGRYQLAVTLRGEPVQGSPFTIQVPLEGAERGGGGTPRTSRGAPRSTPSPLRVNLGRDALVGYD